MINLVLVYMLATASNGRTRAKLSQPGCQEWPTDIEGLNARGLAIQLFVIRVHMLLLLKS
jgi:hypothetical protein